MNVKAILAGLVTIATAFTMLVTSDRDLYPSIAWSLARSLSSSACLLARFKDIF